jgi:hypothetical protein
MPRVHCLETGGLNRLSPAILNSHFSGLGSLTDPALTSTSLPQGRNTPVRQFIDNFVWVKDAAALPRS